LRYDDKDELTKGLEMSLNEGGLSGAFD